MLLHDILDAYAEKYVPTIIDQARTKSCIKNLRAIDGHAEDITYQRLIEFRSARVKGGVSESTANRDMAVLGSALRWARREGMTTAHPDIPRTKERSRARALTFAQVSRLAENAADVKTWAFIWLLFYTAQRKQAVLNLKHSQIRDGKIHFEEQEGPLAHRRKRRATTPLNNKIKAVLARLRAEYGMTEYVIPKGDEGRFVTLDKRFDEAARKARMSWVTPHILRHSACTVLLNNKRSMLEVSQFLGHSNIYITQKSYEHLDPTFLKGASDTMDSL